MVTAERPRIERLSREVASRIAAGEVIERPASVVKELVENAIDAGARRIEIAIVGGGVDELRVRDDGRGIPPDQMAIAFERHATSKLRSEHDLFAVRTLGFRGEALAAIAAAADVELLSRTPEEQAASVVRMRDGARVHEGRAAGAPGTTVQVRDLFAALPARRRFLRSAASETRAVSQVVADYALAYPEVAFQLGVDGRVALRAPGTGDGVDAVAAVHGRQVAELLVPLFASRTAPEGDAEDGVPASVTVRGLIGPPSLHRANRGYIHLFANGRAITSRSLVHAVERAFGGLIPAGRHPVALVRIEVPPAQVDVNVHPRKDEVRFRNERAVFGAVASAVADALLHSPLGDGDPAGHWTAAPAIPADRWQVASPLPSGREIVAGARPAAAFDAQTAALSPPAGGEPLSASRDPLPGRLGALRPLGQAQLTYLVAEAEDGLYLVDQHAAHERVLYEQLLTARARREPASQPLLEPAVVELNPPLAALAGEVAEELASVGWLTERVDGNAFMLRGLPASLRAADPRAQFVDFLDRIDADERLTGPDRVVATLACRAAVMAGDRLDERQQRELLRALEQASRPHSCPHGRPTLLHLSRAAIDRSFGRR